MEQRILCTFVANSREQPKDLFVRVTIALSMDKLGFPTILTPTSTPERSDISRISRISRTCFHQRRGVNSVSDGSLFPRVSARRSEQDNFRVHGTDPASHGEIETSKSFNTKEIGTSICRYIHDTRCYSCCRALRNKNRGVVIK